MKSRTSYFLQSFSSKSSNDKYPGLGTIEIVKERESSTILVNKLHPFVFYKENSEEKQNLLRFMQFCLNLKMWVKHHYDPRLLQNKVSIPLLQRIRSKRDNRVQAALKNKSINNKIITVNVDNNFLNNFDYYDDDEFGIV